MRWTAAACVVLLGALAIGFAGRDSAGDPRLKGSFRRADKNGWVYVHLEGAPAEVGFQHGYLLSNEIEDAHRAITISLVHDSQKPYGYWRDTVATLFLPHIEPEYKAEVEGIAAGLKAKGSKLDVTDVVVLNSFLELPYYKDWWEKVHEGKKQSPKTAEHCSAFVATGSYTRDGRPVVGHNNWSSYREGERWNVIFDIAPARGHHILMDGMAGLIHSGDDFGVNDAGIIITETTISHFLGFEPNAVPEFVRARKAMQYAESIDDFARIMEDGNNGGYANTWLVADTRHNEIGRLELGLKHATLDRAKDGYFVGTNFPINPELIKDETVDFPVGDNSVSPNSRHIRADQLMAENKGKVDLAFGKKYLSDHYDSFDGKTEPGERTLCGHIDLSARGSKPWQPPYGTAGTVQNKLADAAMADQMTFMAAFGHSCGITFHAAAYLQKHSDHAYEKDVLRDLKSQPWTTFQATR